MDCRFPCVEGIKGADLEAASGLYCSSYRDSENVITGSTFNGDMLC